MGKRSQALVVSYNIGNVEVCASAARISTTKGDAIEIFEKSKGNEKNCQLVGKVLQSGHKSVIEHAVFTIALRDVSVFVEQFFIECRLASFTVKSRRYVDFGKSGYYIPPELDGEELNQYCRYMDNLFSAYNTMLENGIPKEDARFLLPYSFHSNFYCTMNARELSNVIHSIRHGRGQDIGELKEIADQIAGQVQEIFPCICFDAEDTPAEDHTQASADHDAHSSGAAACGRESADVSVCGGESFDGMFKVDDEVTFIGRQETGRVELVNEPSDPVRMLKLAYRMNHSDPDTTLECGSHHADADGRLEIEKLLRSDRSRELEQLSYTFLISNITLAGITHIVRHRMQSIIVPPIKGIEHSKVIVPATIEKNPDMCKVYRDVLEKSNRMLQEMGKNERLRRYSYYYALSGNVMDIITTINARELAHFMKLRTCSRAQWEIREIAVKMLGYLRSSCPEIFDCFGPSCFVLGVCPEGRMTCGRREEMTVKFKNLGHKDD